LIILVTENGEGKAANGPEDSRCPCRVCVADRYRPVYYLDDVEIAACRECGLLQISSRRRLHDLKSYYARLSKDPPSFTPEFDQRKILRASRFRARYLQKHTGLTAGRILEIGSSGGHFLAVLQQRGFQVLGVEPSPLGAEQHREKGVPVINDLLEYADLPRAQFDAVCLFQVFEHFENPRQIAERLYSLLKPGGFLVLEIPDIHSTGAKFEKRPHRLFHKEHLTYFSRESLTALMAQAGFTCVAAFHYDYDALRIPFSKSLRKILVPLLQPGFKGPLEKILNQELDIHHYSPAPAGDKPAAASYSRSARSRFKTLRKALTAPLDILCGYLAYRLDRGASLCWLGKKAE
jgi:SAM-dependent methyltransferase